MTKDEARQKLLDAMQDEFSQRCYAAGWMMDLEYDLWEIVRAGSGRYGMCDVSELEALALKLLAEKAGGWWIWQDDEREFVSLDKWEEMVNAKP